VAKCFSLYFFSAPPFHHPWPNAFLHSTAFPSISTAVWWDQHGRSAYPEAKKILVMRDGGGSNSATMYLLEEDLKRLANRLCIEIRVAH
jgi:hypothetical protein